MTTCTTECGALDQELCPIYRGDTVSYDLSFKEPDGTPLDISGMTLSFTMKADPEDTAPALEEVVTFPTNADSQYGIGYIVIEPAKTDLLVPDTYYYYDFQLKTGNDIFTIGAGKVKVLYDITR